jgi:tetratricopeptide (TPR) repeat protein
MLNVPAFLKKALWALLASLAVLFPAALWFMVKLVSDVIRYGDTVNGSESASPWHTAYLVMGTLICLALMTGAILIAGTRKAKLLFIPLTLSVIFLAANLYFMISSREKYLDKLIKYHTEEIRSDPSSPAGYANRGVYYVEKGMYDAALADFSAAIELDPSDKMTLSDRALTYFKKKDFDSAVKDLDTLVSMDPEAGQYYNDRAIMQFFREKYAECLQDARKAGELGYPVSGNFIKEAEKRLRSK